MLIATVSAALKQNQSARLSFYDINDTYPHLSKMFWHFHLSKRSSRRPYFILRELITLFYRIMPERSSFRAYTAILYLDPRMKIYIQVGGGNYRCPFA